MPLAKVNFFNIGPATAGPAGSAPTSLKRETHRFQNAVQCGRSLADISFLLSPPPCSAHSKSSSDSTVSYISNKPFLFDASFT